jgi:hypothetical protein
VQFEKPPRKEAGMPPAGPDRLAYLASPVSATATRMA